VKFNCYVRLTQTVLPKRTPYTLSFLDENCKTRYQSNILGWYRAFFEGHRPICLIDYSPAQSHGIPPSNHIIIRVVLSNAD
jgi:hypothetical protein